jgi:hypothetical protein
MTSFEDRERAEEARFAHDADTLFRIQARRNRLVGEWAAVRMSLSPAETDAYAKSVVQADLTAAGVDTSEGEIRAALEAKQVEARRAFLG